MSLKLVWALVIVLFDECTHGLKLDPTGYISEFFIEYTDKGQW